MARRVTLSERKIHQTTDLPVVCIQCIKTSWTKRSRGSTGAVLRNQVPEALSLVHSDIDGDTRYLMHRAGYGERNDFASPICEKFAASVMPPLGLSSLFLTLLDGGLFVTYKYSHNQGAPERHPDKLPALSLQAGSRGRVLYNGRLVDHDDGTWSYERRVYNIGLFRKVTPDVFLDMQPVKTFSQMAHLW